MFKWAFYLLAFRVIEILTSVQAQELKVIGFLYRPLILEGLFTWIKQCNLANQLMALEKHVCVLWVLANSFLTFSGMKSENYLEKICYIKNNWWNSFLGPSVFKKQNKKKRFCALTLLLNSDRQLSSHGAYLLTLPVFPSQSV